MALRFCVIVDALTRRAGDPVSPRRPLAITITGSQRPPRRPAHLGPRRADRALTVRRMSYSQYARVALRAGVLHTVAPCADSFRDEPHRESFHRVPTNARWVAARAIGAIRLNWFHSSELTPLAERRGALFLKKAVGNETLTQLHRVGGGSRTRVLGARRLRWRRRTRRRCAGGAKFGRARTGFGTCRVIRLGQRLETHALVGRKPD